MDMYEVKERSREKTMRRRYEKEGGGENLREMGVHYCSPD